MPKDNERWSAEWLLPEGLFEIAEPTAAEIAQVAPQLARHYNEPHNYTMMANTVAMSAQDVIASYREMQEGDGRPFLLYARHDASLDGRRLMGDADLRHIDLVQRTAEAAIMIGERSTQGRGLGTRFLTMVHAVAFAGLGLERTYALIIPQNTASRRLFQKLGYEPDDSPQARSYADEASDISLSISRSRFEQLHAEALAAVRVCARG
jgi:RimJ/RimL family protein N-acetyltransferase